MNLTTTPCGALRIILGVSIDYLLGHKSPVTDDERQLLALFRSFTPSQRRLLLEQAELLTHYKIKLDD